MNAKPHTTRWIQRTTQPLTAKELRILQGVADGKGYKQIAAELETTPESVSTMSVMIRRKLNAMHIAHAVVIALRQGKIL